MIIGQKSERVYMPVVIAILQILWDRNIIDTQDSIALPEERIDWTLHNKRIIDVER